MSKLASKLELPEEVTLQEAADVLAVSVRTVRRYIDDELLIARNIAPLRSVKARYRLLLSAVMELRNHGVQEKPQPTKPQRRRQIKRYKPQALRRK